MSDGDDLTAEFEAFLNELEKGRAVISIEEVPDVGRSVGYNGGKASIEAISIMREYLGVIDSLDAGEMDSVHDIPDEEWGYFVELCSHVDGLNVSEESL